MRIAVTGTTGRVGAALASHLTASHEVIPLPRPVFDLADPGKLAAALDRLECDVFLNPAGITSLEACEDDPPAAFRANADAPREIAAWAASRGVPLFHFSTDYVFDGLQRDLCREDSIPVPLSVYGRSKLAGEQAVLAHPLHRVLRVSWVFGPEKASFVDQVIARALAGEPISAIDDKFSLPVLTTDLAVWVENLLTSGETGIFHACNSGEPASWHDLATATVAEMAGCGALPRIPGVARQSLAEIAAFRAVRPRFTAMATPRLTAVLGAPPRPWREALAEYVRSRCSAA